MATPSKLFPPFERGSASQSPVPLDWEIVPTATGTHVRLSGRLDGNGSLVSALAPVLTDARVLFDVSGIRRITSPGVAEWIRFVQALDRRSLVYDFERCSLAFVQQLNMISIFRGSGTIRSFFAPYFCHSCDESIVKLIDARDDVDRQITELPTCALCGQATEFDDVRSAFLSFLEKKSCY